MTRFRSIVILAALVTAACQEQTTNQAENGIVVTGQSAAAPMPPAPQETRGQDFTATTLGAFDFSEASAKLAMERSDQDKVRRYAQQLGSDLTAARAELMTIVQASGLRTEPVAGPTHQSDLAILTSTRGAPLSKAFAEQQIEALTLLVGTMRAYKNGGDNPRLRAWAEKHQGPINERLLDIQTLNAELEAAAEAER